MSGGQARYFDGQSGKPFNVRITLAPSFLTIKNQELEANWFFADIRVMEPCRDGLPAKLSAKTHAEARLVIEDEALFKQIQARLPKKATGLFWVSASKKSLAMWSVVTLAFLAGLYVTLPALFFTLGGYIPLSWEMKLAHMTEESMLEDEDICISPEGKKVLAVLSERLMPKKNRYESINVYVINNSKITNAFALPGGTVVLHRTIIDKAENAEDVAGVLAHEMGHLAHAHPIRSLTQQIGSRAILAMMFGGGDVVELSSSVLSFSYSRDIEREADYMAVDLLKKTDISAQGLVRFFSKLSEEGEEDVFADYMAYLSTHPSSKERIENITALADYEGKKVMSKKDWRALRGICKEHQPFAEIQR